MRGNAEWWLNALGVLTGVVSAGDTLSRSLGVGEWCSGGGVSRESSFTDFTGWQPMEERKGQTDRERVSERVREE